MTDVEEALKATWSQPAPAPASEPVAQPPLSQQVNEFLNNAVTNIFGQLPVTRESSDQDGPSNMTTLRVLLKGITADKR